MSRCFLQGWGKAAMAHMDGFDESTSLERNYAVRILPLGVGRGLKDAVRGDVSGLGRSGAIVAAFAVTVGGYIWYQMESVFRRKSRPARSTVTA
jgi:glucosyl-dolichyl phosphate glucuronosyltransferase